MTLQSGAMIANRYRLDRHIATGGMGAVWESTDQRLGRAVAVKVLKPEYADDAEFLERFREEARTTAKLNHPGIANVYDYGETTDPNGSSIPYLVMELVPGEALNAVIHRMGTIPVDLSLDMMEQSGRALQAAHRAGLVHRDVKPGNILITPTGQVKITDFGIAKAVDAAPVTRAGMVMGTAQYIAPEQALGEEATAASDVYSLGIVGYEALAGQRPFQADNTFAIAQAHVNTPPPPLPNTIPANVRELIGYALTKDPAQRYADGGSFADAVAAVRAGRRPTPPAGLGVAAVSTSSFAPATAVLGSTAMRAEQYRPPVATSYPEDAPTGMSKGQKNLAIGALILLLLAAMIAGGIVLSNLPDSPNVDRTPTTTVPAPTPTTAAPPTTVTTTEAPTTSAQPTTSEQPTPTTTTEQPTAAPPTTTPPVTTPPTSEAPPAPDADTNFQGARPVRGGTGYAIEIPAGHTPADDGEL